MPAQQLPLRHRLDALGHHAQAEAVREGDGSPGDGQVVGVAGDVANEAAIDLQGVERQAPEVGKRGISGSEVIDAQRQSHRAEFVETAGGGLRVFHRCRFGHLEFQHVR